MEAPVIFNLSQVRELESTAYIEIAKGYGTNFWNVDSLYFSECDQLDYFDGLVHDCVPDYDLFDFIDVAPHLVLRLAERLDAAAASSPLAADIYLTVAAWLREHGSNGVAPLGL